MIIMDGIPIQVIRSKRKTTSLEISRNAEVLVRTSDKTSYAAIQKFVNQKQSWIMKHLHAMQDRLEQEAQLPPEKTFPVEKLAELKMQAKTEIPKRAAFYASQIGVTYGRITIRNQKTRWGSCSSKGNLNFNCLLMLAPPEVLDYVVVHELCHLKEMNHSTRFWKEVEKILPDYKVQKKWLKEHGGELIISK